MIKLSNSKQAQCLGLLTLYFNQNTVLHPDTILEVFSLQCYFVDSQLNAICSFRLNDIGQNEQILGWYYIMFKQSHFLLIPLSVTNQGYPIHSELCVILKSSCYEETLYGLFPSFVQTFQCLLMSLDVDISQFKKHCDPRIFFLFYCILYLVYDVHV